MDTTALQSLALLPRYLAHSAWWQHVPTAHWLIGRLKPATVVELGSHYGVSLFSFCEAAEALNTGTFCFGIDSWQGDEHSGAYGEEVYAKVCKEQTLHHLSRCRLIRSTFDEAAAYFGKESIDLLHIDGLHTYEAVRHDYETWAPMLRPGGVILFHDINVRENGFGVWQLWQELQSSSDYRSLTLRHGHGLGILAHHGAPQDWLTDLENAMPALTAKGSLLAQLAELRPECAWGEEDATPYRQRADRTWQELETCRLECERLRQQMAEGASFQA
jgi:hypothetical protein